MLLHNDTPGAGNYLTVKVLGDDGINRMGIGSIVRAFAVGRANDMEAMLASEQVAMGYGFCSAQPPIAHLGLGKTERCDLVITLPHGKGQIVRRDVATNQSLTIASESR